LESLAANPTRPSAVSEFFDETLREVGLESVSSNGLFVGAKNSAIKAQSELLVLLHLNPPRFQFFVILLTILIKK
jgi:hypothetical protein